MTMARRVVLTGFDNDYGDAVLYICELLKSQKVNYSIVTFEDSQGEIDVRVLATGKNPDEAVYRAIDLPTCKQFTANWQKLLKFISQKVSDTLVTIEILNEGQIETQMALNGIILE
jgi:hypothetical protein